MWKKIILPYVVLGLAVVSAGDYDMEANPSKVFIGVQLGGAWVQGTHGSGATEDLNYKTRGLSYGLRLGAQNSEWRTMLTFDHFKNAEAGYWRGEVHADYLLHLMDNVGGVGVTPFIGIDGGYANYEAKGGISESGITYGGEAGVIFDVTDNVDVDVMYEYGLSRASAFDHVGNLKVGVNYKY